MGTQQDCAAMLGWYVHILVVSVSICPSFPRVTADFRCLDFELPTFRHFTGLSHRQWVLSTLWKSGTIQVAKIEASKVQTYPVTSQLWAFIILAYYEWGLCHLLLRLPNTSHFYTLLYNNFLICYRCLITWPASYLRLIYFFFLNQNNFHISQKTTRKCGWSDDWDKELPSLSPQGFSLGRHPKASPPDTSIVPQACPCRVCPEQCARSCLCRPRSAQPTTPSCCW